MRGQRSTFLCNAEERRILAALASKLERSQSDAVRLLIRTAALELNAHGDEIAKHNTALVEVEHANAPH